jgi:tetratricopeptide (TPR) repeat protein
MKLKALPHSIICISVLLILRILDKITTPISVGNSMQYIVCFLLLFCSCGPKPVVQQSPFDTAANQYNRGPTSLERGDFMTAQRAFERARMLDSDYPGIYVGYALVAMERGDFFRAHKELELALHKDNDFVDAYIAQGRLATKEGVSRGEQAKKWLPDALRAYKKAGEKAPNYPPIYLRDADVNLATAGEKAVRSGVEKLTGELVRHLVENWREKMYSGRLVRLVVEGDSEGLGRFETAFPMQVSGVEKLYRHSYIEGTAVFDVLCKNTGFAIARDLTAKGIEGVDIDIIRVTPNSLRIQLVN